MAAGDGGTSGARGSCAPLGPHVEELRALLTAAREGPPDPERVVRFAGRAVPHADHCGLTLLPERGKPRTVASSGDVPSRVDLLQYRLGEGPCLSASTTHDVVRVDDVRTDRRWPLFARACAEETPVRSVVSVRLVLAAGDRASINFYAEQPDAFDETDLDVAAVFAPFAAMALQSSLRAREAAHLHTALDSSRQIGTAVGILMARRLITSEEAFRLLVTTSQKLNRKLRDIAAEVEATGALPQPQPRKPGAANRTPRP